MVSIIIPTYDRPDELRACLDALARLAGATDELEVVVVDDGGRRPARDVVAAFVGRLAVRCIRQENRGPAAARNAGAHEARGEWLGFLDDDCVVTREWWPRLRARCRDAGDAMLGGATRNGLDANPYAACHQMVLDYLCRHFNDGRPGAAIVCTSNNLAVPAAPFRAVGGFDEGYRFAGGEDRDLCDRWRASGRSIVHDEDLLVVHHHPMTLATFWRQHYRYGRGASRYRQRRGAGGSAVGATDRPGFYLGLLRFAWRRTAPARRPGAAALLLLTQVATACGYGVERVRGPL